MVMPLSAVGQTRALNEHSKAKKVVSSIPDKHLNKSGLRTTAYDGIHHLVGFHLDGGYSSLLSTMPSLSSNLGGYGLGFGLDYCYNNKKLILQTGLSLRWQDVGNGVRNDSLSFSMVDSDSKTPFTLRYDFQDRKDISRNLYLQVPIMAGTYFYGFYFLAGLKLSLAFAGNTEVHTTITTSGDYDKYIGPVYQMDNHGFRDHVEEIYRNDRLKLRFDVMACAEIGREWSMGNYGKRGYKKQSAKDYRLRLSAFAEFGILDIEPHTENDAYVIPKNTPYDFITFNVNPVASTKAMWDYSLHNLTAGIRISFFFFGIQTTEKCILCGALGDEKRMWK